MSESERNQLIVEQIEIGPMQNFTYLIGDRDTREVVIVDPAWDIDALIKYVEEKDYKLTGALVTHYHPDHIGGSMGRSDIQGLPELLDKNPVKIYAHKEEASGVIKVTGISD
ncbi:MAG: MBL fold metallo-hydrolase, partial [Pseudomonadota bacterium]